MPFTSPTQPFCRCCGKPIKKTVITHYFAQPPHLAGGSSSWARYRAEPATTKAEAQRLVNGRIVSTRKSYGGQVTVGVWDGESYVDGDFCTDPCATAFGRMAAKLYPHLETQAAFDARAARDAKGAAR